MYEIDVLSSVSLSLFINGYEYESIYFIQKLLQKSYLIEDPKYRLMAFVDIIYVLHRIEFENDAIDLFSECLVLISVLDSFYDASSRWLSKLFDYIRCLENDKRVLFCNGMLRSFESNIAGGRSDALILISEYMLEFNLAENFNIFLSSCSLSSDEYKSVLYSWILFLDKNNLYEFFNQLIIMSLNHESCLLAILKIYTELKLDQNNCDFISKIFLNFYDLNIDLYINSFSCIDNI